MEECDHEDQGYSYGKGSVTMIVKMKAETMMVYQEQDFAIVS